MPSIQRANKFLSRGLQCSSKTLVISREIVTKEIQPFICSLHLNLLQGVNLGKWPLVLSSLVFHRAKPLPEEPVINQELSFKASLFLQGKRFSPRWLWRWVNFLQQIHLPFPGLPTPNAAISLRCSKDKIWVKPLSSQMSVI